MKQLGAWLGCLVCVCGLWACGDDDGGSTTPDTGTPVDGGTPLPPPPRDMGMREDTGPRDMGMREDTGPADTGPADMGMPDEPCDRAGETEQLPCGMCGAQTRFCTSDMTWEYGACEDEHGECNAGDTGSIECGDMMVDARCTDECLWAPLDEMVVCPLPLCTDPLPLAGRMGETVSIDLDTATGPAGPLELGLGCGGADGLDPAMRPPQIVVALTVPGSATSTYGIDFTMINDGTDVEFDTVVQLREDCMTPPVGSGTGVPGMPAPGCYDDTPDPMTGMTDFRSSGRFAARGGDTVFLVITGFAYGGMPPMGRTDRGMGRLDVTVGAELRPPTLTMATVQSSSEETTFTLVGGDPDGDAATVRVTFLDAAGMPVDLNGDMVIDGFDDVFRVLPTEVTAMTSFTTTIVEFGAFLDGQIRGAMATRARVTLVDATGVVSAPLTVDIAFVTTVGFGAACDAMNVCRSPLACTAGTCQASAAVTAACGAAMPISLAGTPATGSATGALLPGDGLFNAPCTTTDGTEALYRVTVPAGAWDLVASNQVAGTPMGTDTVLYVRRTCADAESMGACADDAGGDSRALVVVQDAMPGDYTIFQERFGRTADGMMTMYGLEVRLRPVLAAGAACDPMGVMNRCATGTCPMATPVCPPGPTP